MGISSGPEVIVVDSLLLKERRRQLLALDLRSGLEVHDLTGAVAQLPFSELEAIHVSGPGTLAAVGSRDQIQVLEIPSGKAVYAGPGRFPSLSPDGKRLAFINRERLYMRSLADGSTVPLLSGTRVMAAGD